MRSILSATLAAGSLMLALGSSMAAAQDVVAVDAAERNSQWFVEFASPPTADGTSAVRVEAEQAAFRRNAAAAGIEVVERRSFKTLFNGMAVSIDNDDASRLRKLSGVKAVYPVALVEAPSPPLGGGSAADLATALAMTGADIVRSELGYDGTGIKVGVIDSGIDYNHPDLGGCFGPGCRVAYGTDLVGDAYNADPTSPTYSPVPVPDPDPDDCGGHGTHVSGIVGARGTVTGVAPGVTFGAYRVFGCSGSSDAAVIIDAMEHAYLDGMQVVNQSLGAAYQWPQYPTAQAANRLVKLGVVMVASAGNNGANGLYSLGAPGVASDIIGVASYDNTAVTLNRFTVSPDDATIGYAPATGAPLPPTSGSLPMARTGTNTSTADACTALPAGSLAGMAALIRRGSCTFAVKAANAQAAGAAAVVIYNNVAGRLSATVAGGGITIPVVTISDTEGVLINSRLAAGAVTMTWRSGVGSFPNPTAGLISSFSSYGLSPTLELKPDLGAPGGLIYSTYPLEQGGYATLSGTSMSSPHVAGAAALYLQARGATNGKALRDRLQNTADPAVWSLNPATGLLDHSFRQGAGMLDIDDAILANVSVSPGKLSVGEGEAGPRTFELTVRNSGKTPVTLDLSYENAVSTGGVMTPSFFGSNALVTFDQPTIVVGGDKVKVNVTITPATGPVNGQYGGYIVFQDRDDAAKSYSVPFAGFVGDYQGIVHLTPTANGFPWLAALQGANYVNQPAGATFSLQGSDVPYFLLHLDHQAERLEFQVYEVTADGKQKLRGYADSLRYFGRNSTPTGFFAFNWDGTVYDDVRTYSGQRAMPDGQYVVKIVVLKAGGQSANPAHSETWPSPVITIDRP